MRKHLLKIGVSLIAALGLMAFMAAGAQAETAAPIKVLGSETLHGTATGLGLLGRLHVPALNIEIHCTQSHVTALILSGIATFIIIYLGCKLYQLTPLELLTPCIVGNKGKTEEITVEKVLLKGLLHSTVDKDGTKLNPLVYGVAKPEAGEEFTTLEFKGECPLPAKVIIKGEVGLEATQGEATEVTLKSPATTAASEALQTLLKKELKFGANKSFLIEGAATLKLGEPHLGCKFGAI